MAVVIVIFRRRQGTGIELSSIRSSLGPTNDVNSRGSINSIIMESGKAKSHEINYDELENMKAIGKGSFGVVYRYYS